MRFGQTLRERDTDRAHRDMNRPLWEACDYTVVCEHHLSSRRVVRKHRDNHLAVASIGNPGCPARAHVNERVTLAGGTVEHGDIVSGLYQVTRQSRAHTAQ